MAIHAWRGVRWHHGSADCFWSVKNVLNLDYGARETTVNILKPLNRTPYRLSFITCELYLNKDVKNHFSNKIENKYEINKSRERQTLLN